MTKHVVLALALLLPSLASAQTAVPTTDRKRVLIEYTGPTQLANDFMVMRIRVRNQSGRDRVWAFEFNALEAGHIGGGRRSQFELDVENGQDRHFEILVPLPGASDAGWVQMFVFGYGVANAGQTVNVGNWSRSRVAVSANANLRFPEVRVQLTVDPSGTAILLPFSAESLTDDWRAYSSLSVLWLTADEWKQADSPIRRALTEWVAGGGRLVLVEPSDTPARAPIEHYGMGMIVTIPEGLTADEAGLFEHVKPSAINTAVSISTWMSNLIDPIETHKGFLSLVLLGYLVLAAPVNLLVFSPGRKRMRLFWTMPAIALGASAVMAAVILLQDGVGGSGYRANFVYLQPDLNRELIVQEQVSKTGALLRRSFDIGEAEAVVITDITTAYQGFQQTSALGSHGARYTGDWFRSRTIQAQRLQWARSSRARIERVGVDSGRPTILSSIDVPLEELYYRDQSGSVWHGKNILPGRPALLQSVSDVAYQQFPREVAFRTAGPVIRARVDAIRGLSGAFLAIAASHGSDVAIETLTSIDWTDGPVLYAGHVKNDVWEAAR